MRLADGEADDRGRVEMCIGGVWNTICADSLWNDEEATTVCRQLGFASPESEYIIHSLLFSHY